ncbi:hypothetical protein ACO2RV_20325 [Ancylobacter sp. VNQ12]|uniref:hypothetical protein n=1 Tax=Ancylobacter sp. VNQ12 TaxID=3400920 RepID=UPI003C10D310
MGLIVGPLTAPVSGPTMAAASTMAEMPGDMPCCPNEAPAVPDCQKSCPLLAICMAKCFSVAPLLASPAFVLREGGAMRPGSDTMGATLAIEPPARPPRT